LGAQKILLAYVQRTAGVDKTPGNEEATLESSQTVLCSKTIFWVVKKSATI